MDAVAIGLLVLLIICGWLLSRGVEPLPVNAILRFVAALVAAMLFIRVVARSRFIPIVIPSYTHLGLSLCCAWGTVTLYYLRTDSLPTWWRVSVLLMLLGCVYTGTILVALSVAVSLVVMRLRRDFAANCPAALKPPYVVVHGVGASNEQFVRTTILMLTRYLWRFRELAPSEETLDALRALEGQMWARPQPTGRLAGAMSFVRFMLGIFIAWIQRVLSQRPFVVFVPWRDLEKYPGAFRRYVVRSAPAFVSVMPSRELRVVVETAEKFERAMAEESGIGARIVRAVLRASAGRARALQPEAREVRLDLHRCIGPACVLLPQMGFLSSEMSGTATLGGFAHDGYEVVRASRRESTTYIASVAQVLGSTCLPMARSDTQLTPALRRLIPVIGRGGLAPLADCYLRFRLSRSDVERFLCLLDCFEVVVKYSVIALIAAAGQALTDEEMHQVAEGLRRPSLGTWLSTMRTLLQATAGTGGSLPEAIRLWWSQPLRGPTVELIDVANGSGLSWQGQLPRSHLGWLEWLTWIRNVTKGHGAVEERTASTIWPKFHETWLQVVSDLQPLTLHSTIIERIEPGRERSLSGWLRGGVREAALRHPDSVLEPERGYAYARLRYASGDYRLAPLVCICGDSCLTWNSQKGDAGEYADYASGQLKRVRVADIARG